jgi:uncharacterized protein YbjQ (UPF0145 family)
MKKSLSASWRLLRPAAVLLMLSLSACGPKAHLAIVDMSQQAPDDVAKSMTVQIFEGVNSSPKIVKPIGLVNATSCKHLTSDPPATRGDALRQLRFKASKLGANAVVNVYFDSRGTDPWGTNCWESVTATGDAVIIAE